MEGQKQQQPHQMSYQNKQRWLSSITHKSLKMMNMCSGPTSTIGKYISQITVEPVLFLYMLSTFSQYALFQDLVYSKVCWSEFSKESDICQHLHNEEYKEQLELVQTLSSHWILMSTISLVLPSILIAMYLGSWSDRYGRKWPVVFPTFGGVCACLVYIYISVVEESPVGLICLASLLSGLTGGFVSCIMSCMTYVATVTTEDNRTVRISRLEAMTFFGGTIGPFISGSMLEITGHAYAFFYMMLCYAFAFLYAILFVKDIDKDGLILENNKSSHNNANTLAVISDEDDEEDYYEDDEGNNSHHHRRRRRNKSSDTLPSSVVAATLSTTSGEEDMEQKCRLLSASDLHVAVVATPEFHGSQNNPPHHNGILPEGVNEDELGYQEISRISPIGNEIEDSMMITVLSSNDHTPPGLHHHQRQHHNSNDNRISMGGSSGRNSSLHGHDDGSSATSDDDQRRMLRKTGHSNLSGELRREAENDDDESSSCCMKYFGTGHFLSAVTTAFRRRENGRRTLLLLSLLAGFMFMVITAGEMDVAYLFARAEPLKWNYQTYSYFFGFKYGFGAFVLLIATPFLHKLGVEDTTLAIVGIFSRMGALVMYGLSVNSYMAFSVPLVAVFSVFTIPATRSLLSKLVNQDEQGKMFAFVAMMEDLCTLTASLIFNSIYPLTRPILQGMIFLLAAGTLIVPIGIMCFVRCRMRKFQRKEEVSRRMANTRLSSEEKTDPAGILCIQKEKEVVVRSCT